MSRTQKIKEKERYYLLPGMGGESFRRKHRTAFRWSLAAGILVSAAVAAVLYLMSGGSRP